MLPISRPYGKVNMFITHICHTHSHTSRKQTLQLVRFDKANKALQQFMNQNTPLTPYAPLSLQLKLCQQEMLYQVAESSFAPPHLISTKKQTNGALTPEM